MDAAELAGSLGRLLQLGSPNSPQGACRDTFVSWVQVREQKGPSPMRALSGAVLTTRSVLLRGSPAKR